MSVEIFWVVATAGRAWGRPGTWCRTKNCSQLANSVKAESPWLKSNTDLLGFWNLFWRRPDSHFKALAKMERMPTDQSPVLQLPPGLAVRDGPPCSPGKYEMPLTQGWWCRVARRPGTQKKAVRTGAWKGFFMVGEACQLKGEDYDKGWKTTDRLALGAATETPPRHLTWQRQRWPRVWITGSVVKIGKISTLEKVLEEQDEKKNFKAPRNVFKSKSYSLGCSCPKLSEGIWGRRAQPASMSSAGRGVPFPQPAELPSSCSSGVYLCFEK